MPCKATKSKASSSKSPKKNEKGEIISWCNDSPDGQLLSVLFDQGIINSQTAGAMKNEYKQIDMYSNKTLGGVLSNICKKVAKEVDTRKHVDQQ
eukprot:6985381-Ditylum_brightwellii.AAC.1